MFTIFFQTDCETINNAVGFSVRKRLFKIIFYH